MPLCGAFPLPRILKQDRKWSQSRPYYVLSRTDGPRQECNTSKHSNKSYVGGLLD